MTEFPSFKRLNNIPLYIYIYTYHNLFIHLSIDGHFNCFYFLAVVNSAAMNIDVQVPPQDSTLSSFGYIPRSGIVGSYGSCSFHFFWSLHTHS